MNVVARREALTEEAAWEALVTLARYLRADADPSTGRYGLMRDATGQWCVNGTGRRGGAALMVTLDEDASWDAHMPLSDGAVRLLDTYLPLCHAAARPRALPYTVAHLGQSLDGRIGPVAGAAWVTGPDDIRHNHRMRALFDAVLVGARTVRRDNPQLTVRAVSGRNPVRVVIDARRRLAAEHTVFADAAAPTLVLCAQRHARGVDQGHAAALAIAGPDAFAPKALLEALGARTIRSVFIEGGGYTVSRFLEAHCLDRLQITVAPVILGAGEDGIRIDALPAGGLRPEVRRIPLGQDVMFECIFDG